MKRKPSPALVVSIIALFVALGGTSYAAVKLNGKNIKKGTVSGTALKKNTLTGTQIDESKLGKVPSATTADRALSADSAGSAATIAGIAPDSLVKGNAVVITRNATVPVSSTATLLEIPGLMRISGVCNAGSQLGLRFDSFADGVSMKYSVVHLTTTVTSGGSAFNAGNYLATSAYTNPSFQISIWRHAYSSVAYTVNGSSLQCNASAVAVGHG